MFLTGFMTWTWGEDGALGPQMYSWYHILWLVIMFILIAGAVIYGKKNKNPKVVDRNILIISIVLIISEILKQLMYHVGYYGYLRIDVLPFSLCSIPMYAGLVGSLVNNEKIKNACYGFLAFFGVVGGLGSMFYPVTLETSLVYTSIQTMFWHTSLVVIATYLIVTKEFGKSFKKEIIPAFIVFACCSLIAIGLNELSYHVYLEPRQAPVCIVDRTPGSYQYYKYGFQTDDKFNFIGENDGKLELVDNYQDGINVVITYPEGSDYSTYLLSFEDSDGKNKYIELSDSKEVVLVDTPTKEWEFAWIESDRALFAMNIFGESYCLELKDNQLKVTSTKEHNEIVSWIDFIDGSVLSEGDSANFFFISNHCPTPIPVLNLIQPVVPYPVFCLIYIGGFLSISSGIWGLTYGIQKLIPNKETI